VLTPWLPHGESTLARESGHSGFSKSPKNDIANRVAKSIDPIRSIEILSRPGTDQRSPVKVDLPHSAGPE
jgi:hypothetical protein